MKKLLISLILILILFFWFHIFYKYTLNDSDSLKIYDKNWILLYDVRQDYRKTDYQSISQVPQTIKDMILFREDKRFYKHMWVDLIAIIRATYENAQNFKVVQWASTIDQQVIKLSQWNFARWITSKIKEQFWSFNINLHYSKDDILLYYVNNLTFWNWVKWFNTACNIYFWKDCWNLTDIHIAYLFSISKFPDKKDVSNYSYEFSKRFFPDRNYTLTDFKTIKATKWFYMQKKAPFFIDYTLEKTDSKTKYLQTSFDFNLYNNIQWIFRNFTPYLNSKSAYDWCVIVMDKNWNIVSMNVLREYGDKFGWYINGCDMKRQLWSALKPFLYTLAFESFWYTWWTLIADEPVSYFLDNWWKYEPKNFDMKYHGKVPMAYALWSSLNIPAVKLANQVWIDRFRDYLRKIWSIVGTEEKWNDDVSSFWLSIALWTKELTPIDFAKLWTIFLMKDTQFNDNNKQQFFQKYWSSMEKIKEILSQNQNRLISFPQYNWFDLPSTFVKSWTSRNFIDWWVCGWKNDKIVCVWVGNYNAKPMKDSWYNTAWVIWNNVMKIVE